MGLTLSVEVDVEGWCCYREACRDCGEELAEVFAEVFTNVELELMLFWLLPLEAGVVELFFRISRRLPAASFFWSQEDVSRKVGNRIICELECVLVGHTEAMVMRLVKWWSGDARLLEM